MVDYGLKNRVALITGMNNPYGIGAATALAFAREGAKLVLVYKKIPRLYDENKTDRNGTDRYYAANAGNSDAVERKLKEIGADYMILFLASRQARSLTGQVIKVSGGHAL